LAPQPLHTAVATLPSFSLLSSSHTCCTDRILSVRLALSTIHRRLLLPYALWVALSRVLEGKTNG